MERPGPKRGTSFRRRVSFRRQSTTAIVPTDKNNAKRQVHRRHSDGGALVHRSTSTTREEWDVYVRTLCGRQFVIMVNPYDTIDAVRMKIRMKEGISEDQQRLLFKGRQLEEGTCLDWDLYDSCIICLTLRLRGG